MHGSKEIAREPGVFHHYHDDLVNYVWTLDGRFAAAIDFGKLNENRGKSLELIAIDSQTGRVQRITCPGCMSMVAIGGSKLLITKEEGAKENLTPLLGLDLSATRPPVRTEISTQLPYAPGYLRFASGVSGRALAVMPPMSIKDDSLEGDNLSLVNFEGTVTPIGRSGHNSKVVLASSTERGADGKAWIALYESSQLNAYGQNDKLVLLDPTTGKATDTDLAPMLKLVGNQPKANVEIRAHDLWWGADGHLRASCSVFSRDAAGGPEPLPKLATTLWRLDGIRWSQVAPEDVRAVRQLDKNTKAVLTPVDGVSDYGSLYFEEGGKRSLVAEKVRAIWGPS